MKDFLGQEIKAGCTIVYPTRRGSSMWLNTLKVTQVDDVITGYNSSGRRLHIRNNQNCIVVDEREVTNGN